MLKVLGLNRREQRLNSGALSFEKKKLRFHLDQDFIPISFQVDLRNQAMFVVEEFMLLANQFVAIKLADTCRKVALLRNHPFPKEEKITKFNVNIL
jgi:exoribonuclease R